MSDDPIYDKLVEQIELHAKTFSGTDEEKKALLCQFMSGITWACSSLARNEGALSPQRLDAAVTKLAGEMGMKVGVMEIDITKASLTMLLLSMQTCQEAFTREENRIYEAVLEELSRHDDARYPPGHEFDSV